MATINITNARKNLYTLVEELQESHEPLTITGKKGSAVLISESDWAAIQETLYLTSIPGMRESIISGMKEKLEDGADTLSW
ncbi:type II toxin-antitoxin system Phd/YefM family antitoxin [Breznakiella homolactica]|uniref:Antitoxin n=1 Tax=Breznakiella homolactica TaxID=2798577 RepID=A0A7T7XK27_9SPIR|nr:type II toxin-antitoxin system Phd/YefM family antitoxin [Breznakiella homolactica]QQO07859.1 type II toxin-antitoxin system Phd/YefM family antitoxin [Breznakiella homolactica]